MIVSEKTVVVFGALIADRAMSAIAADVQVFLGDLFNDIDSILGPLVFVGRHQTHMTFGKRLLFQLGHRTQYRDAAILFDTGA